MPLKKALQGYQAQETKQGWQRFFAQGQRICKAIKEQGQRTRPAPSIYYPAMLLYHHSFFYHSFFYHHFCYILSYHLFLFFLTYCSFSSFSFFFLILNSSFKDNMSVMGDTPLPPTTHLNAPGIELGFKRKCIIDLR